MPTLASSPPSTSTPFTKQNIEQRPAVEGAGKRVGIAAVQDCKHRHHPSRARHQPSSRVPAGKPRPAAGDIDSTPRSRRIEVRLQSAGQGTQHLTTPGTEHFLLSLLTAQPQPQPPMCRIR
ncbi:hypothetical protein P3342_001877 [Pyrenophora teres f. teres]|nr:hypothetical protein P3342_001877 [Pyrenophora teres f. teres]